MGRVLGTKSNECQEIILEMEETNNYEMTLIYIVKNLESFLYKAAAKAGKVVKKKKAKVPPNKYYQNVKWLDRDLVQMKRSLMKLGKDLIKSPFDNGIRARFFCFKKVYKKTVKAKEQQYRTSLINKLRNLSRVQP
jgi:hypothetical protein